MKRKERHDTEASIGTFVIAMLLLLMFLFVSFSNKLDEDVELSGGIEVIFGEPNVGGPDNSAKKGSPARSTPATPKFQQKTPQADVTMDNDDAVVIKKRKPTKNPSKNTKPTKPVKKQPTPEEIEAAKKQAALDRLNKILNKSGSGAGGQDNKGRGRGPNSGKTGAEGQKNGGDKGSPTGPGGAGGGTSKGIGIGGNVGNRSITQFPKNTEKYNTKCFVKVKVTVDKKGNVTHAEGTRGTRCGNTKLLKLAIKLAYRTKFQSTTSGPPKAEGVMSFNFGLK